MILNKLKTPDLDLDDDLTTANKVITSIVSLYSIIIENTIDLVISCKITNDFEFDIIEYYKIIIKLLFRSTECNISRRRFDFTLLYVRRCTIIHIRI